MQPTIPYQVTWSCTFAIAIILLLIRMNISVLVCISIYKQNQSKMTELFEHLEQLAVEIKLNTILIM